MLDELKIRQEIIVTAKHLYNKDMLAAFDGNISYKIREDYILITPAATAKAFMREEDICTITLDNKILSGNPSSERLMHLGVYKKCKEARCIVHAHPPTAIAWSIARPHLKELPSESLSELILGAGKIPIAPYARPGTHAMSDVLTPFLPKHSLIILARHGALSWACSLREALNGMERLEHSAKILLRAEQLGGVTNLPEGELIFLKKLRKKICNDGTPHLL